MTALVPSAIAPSAWFVQAGAVARAEALKLKHDPMELFSRAVQPVLWLVLFGEVMSKVRGLSTGGSYLDFLAPGILAQSVLFTAIFYGLSAIWERDLGVLHRYMVSPAPRSAIVAGKAISSGIRGLVQAVFIYFCAAALGVDVALGPLHLLGVIALILLGAALFSTFSLVIACIVRTRERFMGIGQVLTMPIFFASNAIYPVDLMTPWLRAISSVNPLSYEVDALRALMLAHGAAGFGLARDYGSLAAGLLVLIVIATRMLPRLTQ